MEKKTMGLVFFDGNSIGKFNYHTAEDSYGRRFIIDLQINETYVNITNGRSQELRFCVMEEITPNYLRLVDDLGLGTVEGKCFSFQNVAIYDEATFWKSPIPKENLN